MTGPVTKGIWYLSVPGTFRVPAPWRPDRSLPTGEMACVCLRCDPHVIRSCSAGLAFWDSPKGKVCGKGDLSGTHVGRRTPSGWPYRLSVTDARRSDVDVGICSDSVGRENQERSRIYSWYRLFHYKLLVTVLCRRWQSNGRSVFVCEAMTPHGSGGALTGSVSV